MFSNNDLKQFADKGINKELAEEQIENFRNGFDFINIRKAATDGDGILCLTDELVRELVIRYHSWSVNHKIVKFVPASGAASRMFKDLFSFLEQLENGISQDKLLEVDGNQSLKTFVSEIQSFAFYNDLNNMLGDSCEEVCRKMEKGGIARVLSTLLLNDGLAYGNSPKGLLKFHSYKNEVRTALEEHLAEGADYAQSKDGQVNIHLTVSPEHIPGFERKINEVKERYEKEFSVSYDISYSIQKASTDTIAVDSDNKPFRNKDGNILFRPGGHGALLENLNEIDADLIFVKNIDNIVPDKLKEPTAIYKKALAGILLTFRDKIFGYINRLKVPVNMIDNSLLDEIVSFLEVDLCTIAAKDIRSKSKEEMLVYCLQMLNRPLRVCGMVKNEGEPGGGPFWVKNSDGTTSLQIVEGSQIDMKNHDQLTILKNATHFNPVDLVCSVYNHKGEKFDLLNFRDPKTGFISLKSSDGRELKAQELPGLWNGAMAFWNTIFVEVPIITFNPVKTVFDLLRDEHQG